MNLNFLARNVTDIILNPVKAWQNIHTQNRPAIFLVWNLFFPLILLAAASAVTGSILFNNPGLAISYSLVAGTKYLILFFLVIFGTALIFKEVTNLLNAGRDFMISFRIIGYSLIPFILCQILSLTFESFIFVNILAFYGLYICWTGMEKLLKTTEKQKLILIVSAVVVFITLFTIINRILSLAADKIYFTFLA